jgi:YidC/Oxa1 family membrane protein insertase
VNALKSLIPYIPIVLAIAFSTPNAEGVEAKHLVQPPATSSISEDLQMLMLNEVLEQYQFSGLARYYNRIDFYLINEARIEPIEPRATIILKENQWFAGVGRFNALVIKSPGLSINIEEALLSVINPEVFTEFDSIIGVVPKSEAHSIARELDQIRYPHLWKSFSSIARIVESTLLSIQSHIVSSWGVTLLVFAIILKVLLLPISILTIRFQRSVSRIQSTLAPKLAEIERNYDSEEAHIRSIAAHRELGISPFYTLKPLIGPLLQVPILIGTFNALGEMPQFDGNSFLWIENLAYPDFIGSLGYSLPMLGSNISLLPILMTVITLISTMMYSDSHAPVTEVQRQKRSLYLMTAGFFFLFYPFPAAMVLYWTYSNLLHIAQQHVIRA